MTASQKRWISSILRWSVAAVGIAYVIWNIRFHDRVRLLTAGANPAVDDVIVWNDAKDTDSQFVVGDDRRTVVRSDLWTRPDRSKVAVTDSSGVHSVQLLAVRPTGPLPSPVRDMLVQDDAGSRVVPHSAVAPGQSPLVTSYPLVEYGVNRMVREAEWGFLAAAILVMPLVYLLTGYRWYTLLRSQGVQIGIARTFILNLVGAFYNSFMPGSTGGDVAKAWYASKHTPHRARAILTVIVDRVIGLLALLVLGGVMAAFQWQIRECRNVAIASALILGGTAVGLLLFYQPVLRRRSGLNWLLARLPMQHHITQIVHAMELYGRQPRTVLWAFLCSMPVHVTTIVSAMLSGMAFHLNLTPLFYWVIVPVIALVGAVPISPQGAGVMEFFAVKLTIHRGVTIAQAVALVMSIRLVSMFWNLMSGILVLRGNYHAPTADEQHQLEEEAEGPIDEAGDSDSTSHPALASSSPTGLSPPVAS